MTKYSLGDNKRRSQLFSVFGENDSVIAYDNPFIIHYADKRKPWRDIQCLFSEKWWEVCSKTPFFEEMFKELKKASQKSKGQQSKGQHKVGKTIPSIRSYVRNLMRKLDFLR